MWKASSSTLGLSVYGAPGPVNMLGQLAICLSVCLDRWSTRGPVTDEPLDLQHDSVIGLNAIHFMLSGISFIFFPAEKMTVQICAMKTYHVSRKVQYQFKVF